MSTPTPRPPGDTSQDFHALSTEWYGSSPTATLTNPTMWHLNRERARQTLACASAIVERFDLHAWIESLREHQAILEGVAVRRCELAAGGLRLLG